jgi:hypothetical protein
MLVESPGGFSGAIETGDDLAVHVDHLALRIDSEPGPGIVDHSRRLDRIKRTICSDKKLALESECPLHSIHTLLRINQEYTLKRIKYI